MKDESNPAGGSSQHRSHIIVRLPGVNHDRPSVSLGKFQLCLKRPSLDVTWRVIVVVIEARLAHRHHSRIIERIDDAGARIVRP